MCIHEPGRDLEFDEYPGGDLGLDESKCVWSKM